MRLLLLLLSFAFALVCLCCCLFVACRVEMFVVVAFFVVEDFCCLLCWFQLIDVPRCALLLFAVCVLFSAFSGVLVVFSFSAWACLCFCVMF